LTVRRLRLTLEYDGAPFCGWQRQPDRRSVQGEVETALYSILGHEVTLTGSGRTDAGVHALGQVASFTTPTDRAASAVRNGLDALLPAEIACVHAEEVPIAFDPRKDAHWKHYRYRWVNRPSRSPLRARQADHVRGPLDVAAMASAASHLVGTHDFTSFRAVGSSVETTVRTILSARVSAHDDEVWLDVVGTGFLRHMVRIVAGTLAQVGAKRRPPDDLRDALAAMDRARAGPTAPPHGLVLVAVGYAARPDDG
jgi:tRNA pseudouridine38-40 synthase